MNEKLMRRETFIPLVDALNAAVTYDRLEDAECILTTLRILRPRMIELDVFEAWIMMKRRFWKDAINTLHNVRDSPTSSSLATALMAFCQFATGDAEWKVNANRVMEGDSREEALGLVRLLLDPTLANRDTGASDHAPIMPSASVAGAKYVQGAFLRA